MAPASQNASPSASMPSGRASSWLVGLLATATVLVASAGLVATLTHQLVERGRYPVFDQAPAAYLWQWAVVALRAALPAAVVLGLLVVVAHRYGRHLVARRTAWVVMSLAAGLVVVAVGSDVLRQRAVELRLLGDDLPTFDYVPALPDEVSAAEVDPGRNDVVLITIDTLRADHLGHNGYHRDTSPFLDRLAARGVSFTAAVAQAPMTRLSMASMLSGLHSHAVQLERSTRGGAQLSDGFQMLAEQMQAAGYDTAAFVTNPNLKATNGFAQGFETYDQHSAMYGSRSFRRQLNARHLMDAAIAWLEGRPAEDPRPIFLWLHVLDPHHPYEPDEPGPWEDTDTETFRTLDADYRSMGVERMTNHMGRLASGEVPFRPGELEYLVNRYDSEILQSDRQVERFFGAWSAAGRDLDQTLFLITSDHGEEFEDHGGLLHAHTLYDELIRVPLVVTGPGFDHGRPVRGQVALLDVMPTVLRAAGLTPRGLPGRPLQDVVVSSGARIGRPTLSFKSRKQVVLRTDHHKMHTTLRIVEPGCPTGSPWSDLLRLYAARYLEDDAWPEQDGEAQIYDLTADPGESVVADDPWLRHQLLCDLAEALRDHPLVRLPDGTAQEGLSEEDKENLRALGYVVD